MKGVIYTELIEMIEDLLGLEMTNKIIEDARLENEGAYTAVGYYHHQDIIKLMDSISKNAGNSRENLLWSYGEYLFYRLNDMYKQELAACTDAFSFVESLAKIIRIEILKYNPGASVSLLQVIQKNADTLELLYSSDRRLSKLLEGILAACARHYPQTIRLQCTKLESDGSRVRFILTRQSHE